MIAPYFPAIFIPIVGLFLPLISMCVFFLYIEEENID